MIDRVSYLISSHRDYAEPLARLLATMRGLHALVVIGGCRARRGSYDRDVAHIEVAHNSFDYTALIEVVEEDWELSEHLFLLHDTMLLGPDADRLIRAADPRVKAVAVWGGQCNLGLYRADYLRQCRAQLLGLKNCSKASAVEMEGFLWRQLPKDARGVYGGTIEVSEDWPVYGGAPRRVEYYSGVDITKYKANWGQHGTPQVMRP